MEGIYTSSNQAKQLKYVASTDINTYRNKYLETEMTTCLWKALTISLRN